MKLIIAVHLWQLAFPKTTAIGFGSIVDVQPAPFEPL